MFPIHSGCLTTTLLHQTHLCTSSSLPLSFSRGSGTVSLRSTKHILFQLLLPKLYLAFWACLRPGFVQKTQQPLLHSLTTSPSLTSRQVRKGGGTGLLISNNCKYSTYTPLCNNHSLESHAITVTAPVKLHVVVIFRPPGQLGTFLEELDGLLSSFAEDGSPLVVFGDFNIHLDKPYAANFHSLLASIDLKRLTTTSTHKSGSQLALIYTRNFVADNLLVKPLHTFDHYFITFNLHHATSEPPTPLPVTFRWNDRSLAPSHLSSVVSSSLPSPTHFSALYVNAATDTLCSTWTSCLDNICPLSSGPARAAPSNSWLSDVLCYIGPNSGPHCQGFILPQQD